MALSLCGGVHVAQIWLSSTRVRPLTAAALKPVRTCDWPVEAAGIADCHDAQPATFTGIRPPRRA
jgi:hypothetical protein